MRVALLRWIFVITKPHIGMGHSLVVRAEGVALDFVSRRVSVRRVGAAEDANNEGRAHHGICFRPEADLHRSQEL